MPSEISNYKCPACTGPLHFVGASGKLECDYCGSTYDVAEIEKLYAQQDQQATEAFAQTEDSVTGEGEWAYTGSENWEEGTRVYNCPSCGADLVFDATTTATSCPYCDNPTIVPGSMTGTYKPDYVIPFKYSKEQAIAALKNHYKGKRFLPSAFTSGNHVEEIKGVYVPFWLFDGTAEAAVTFDATRSHVHTTRNEEITETDHFDVYRQGTVQFAGIPVDASKNMSDEHMDSIEPYDYSEFKPFSNAYLAGFMADKYDVDTDEAAPRADERAANSAVNAMAQSVQGFQSVTVKTRNVKLNRGSVHYALLPVWLLNTKWNGQTYTFAMNGQTGKLVGNLPMDKGKFWKTFAIIAAAVTAVVSVLMSFC